MCCDNTYFGFKNIQTDLITAENGVAITPVTAAQYVAGKPAAAIGQWWIQRSRYGGAVLCTDTIDFGQSVTFTVSNGMTTYETTPCEFIGPHPTSSHGHIV